MMEMKSRFGIAANNAVGSEESINHFLLELCDKALVSSCG